MKAYRLSNTADSGSTFQAGTIPDLKLIQAKYFFADTGTGAQKLDHPAPREQYVVTLMGKLEFTVTNGDTFVIEPGVILVAQDIHGAGHRWRILDGDEWHRIYIVPEHSAEELSFIPDKS